MSAVAEHRCWQLSGVCGGAPLGAPERCPRSTQLACVLWQEPAQEICFKNQVMFPSGGSCKGWGLHLGDSLAPKPAAKSVSAVSACESPPVTITICGFFTQPFFCTFIQFYTVFSVLLYSCDGFKSAKSKVNF